MLDELEPKHSRQQPYEQQQRRLNTFGQGWKRQSIAFGNKAKNVLVDFLADVKGTTSCPDYLEQRGRNHPDDMEFPSEVECRMCLEQGIFRRCCSNYYCHNCFYKSGSCPGCEEVVPLTGIAAAEKNKYDPGKFAVGLSWSVSAFLVVATGVGLALFYWNSVTSPVTVWGHVCRGWFPVCDLDVCVDYDGGNGNDDLGYGEGMRGIPVAQPYRVCDRSRTSNRVVGSACIYDEELYAWSEGTIGYDICTLSPREVKSRPMTVTSPNPFLPLADSLAGVYVFDDDFESPRSDFSAPWMEITNGNPSDACGINSELTERGNHGEFRALENRNALVFTGVYFRKAATSGLNVEHGGRVEFYLKMGPIASDNAVCKASFEDVILEYNVADQWVEFGNYPAWKFRSDSFQFVSEDIPVEGWTNSTRFRFRQPSFDPLRDHWAIDDVRIFSRYRPDWDESEEYRKRRENQNSIVKLAQCCYNSDQCTIFDKVNTNFDEKKCNALPGFDKNERNLRLKSSELFIFFSFLSAISKVLYHRVSQIFTRRVIHQKEAPLPGSFLNENSDMFPRRAFYSISEVSWQAFVVGILLGSFGGAMYQLVKSLSIVECFDHREITAASCQLNSSFVITWLCAIVFDLRSISMLTSGVFFVKREPVEILVDVHPDKGLMKVGPKTIALAEVLDIYLRSPFFLGFLSFCYILGGFPWALGSLTLPSFESHPSMQVYTQVMGLLTLLRELLGPGLFAKAFFTTQWILVTRPEDRDEFGRAFLRRGLLQQFIAGSCLTPIILASTIMSRKVGFVSSGETFGIFALCVVFGGVFGYLIGVLRGLPCDGFCLITGWPTRNCYNVVCNDRVKCPCLFTCTYCGEIHSRRMVLVVVLPFDDMFLFKRMLKGDLKDIP